MCQIHKESGPRPHFCNDCAREREVPPTTIKKRLRLLDEDRDRIVIIRNFDHRGVDRVSLAFTSCSN